jgi:tRNA pseudouridine38-40 synthase
VADQHDGLDLDRPRSSLERNLRITLAYDGTLFHGWQIQPAVRTVQGELVAALGRVVGRPVRVVGASRTDAGVHAKGQVASAWIESTLECAELARALNALTGDDLLIRSVDDAYSTFHARFSVHGKRYRYRIHNAPLAEPWSRAHAWHVARPLDLAGIRAEAVALLGRHDFSSFQASGSDVSSPVRELRRLDVELDGDEVSVVLEGDGFLRHMVRNIVGTLVDVGLRRRALGTTRPTLEARTRAAAGPTAPAHGLWLDEVFYPPDLEETTTTR